MRYRDIEEIEDHDDNQHDRHRRGGNRRRHWDQRGRSARRDAKPFRADGRESFKCGHCKAFIGPTVSGGRHRNHCPLCLYSRHVDGSTPGDRASGSTVQPVSGPFRPYSVSGASGLAFRFRDSTGAWLSGPAALTRATQVEIAARAVTPGIVRIPGRQVGPAADSSFTAVSLRNVR